MPILLPDDLNIEIPELYPIRQKFQGVSLPDIAARISELFELPGIGERIVPGQRVALAIGSRGIDHIDVLAAEVIAQLKMRGVQPFIVAAMGSHGGGTKAGRLAVLESFGITEETMGVSISADDETVHLGQVGSIPIFTSKEALEADMTILINRVKPHTDFNGPVESGLCKMAVIGLGGHVGCSAIHQVGFKNFATLIPDAAALILENGNIGFGIAIIENSEDRIAEIHAIPAEQIFTRESELLIKAQAYMPRIRIPEIDILLVDEIGKNFSGGGMDPNIVGRYGPKAEREDIPDIKVLVVHRLSEGTHGNASGIGMADITTEAVLFSIDFESTYANVFAVGDGYETAHIPIVMKDEREAFCGAVKLWGGDLKKCRVVQIKNTLQLGEIRVSSALLPYVLEHPAFFELGE
ncbi:MAG: nickel-dependent lactate racemase [Clostridiales Family XIII bacterium]|jgi:hypothetical protein|nr:nickel-dependent lactate racemase [Clostridiales Family XIII bacterium]